MMNGASRRGARRPQRSATIALALISCTVLGGCAHSTAHGARALAADGGADGAARDAAADAGSARLLDERAVDSRTLDLVIESPALGTSVGVRLLLPPAWNSRPAERWPVLYLLHGFRSATSSDPPNPQVWTYHTDLEAFTANTNVLVVMPEGGNAGWYSDWYNDGNGGPPRWETFHLVELPRLLETQYRASTRRAIAGLSMGGFGAASYAARHPGMFEAVASFSGALYTTKYADIVEASLVLDGDDEDRLWGNGDPTNPANRLDIWKQHDPWYLAGQLVGVPLFVSAGNGAPGPFDAADAGTDVIEQGALDSAQAFVAQIQQHGGTVTADLYGAGTHTWPYWQQELHRAFPMLMSAIGIPYP